MHQQSNNYLESGKADTWVFTVTHGIIKWWHLQHIKSALWYLHTYCVNIDQDSSEAHRGGTYPHCNSCLHETNVYRGKKKASLLVTLKLTVFPTQAFSYQNKFTQDPPNRFTNLKFPARMRGYNWKTNTFKTDSNIQNRLNVLMSCQTSKEVSSYPITYSSFQALSQW